MISLSCRRVSKRYRAAVWGMLQGSGEVAMPLGGRPCLTRWSAVSQPLPLPAAAAQIVHRSSSSSDGGGGAVPAEPSNAAAGGGSDGSDRGSSGHPSGIGNGSAAALRSWQQVLTIMDLWPHTGAPDATAAVLPVMLRVWPYSSVLTPLRTHANTVRGDYDVKFVALWN